MPGWGGRGQLEEPVEVQHRRGIGCGDGHMMVGHQKEIQCVVARSGSDVHDDYFGLKVLEMADEPFLFRIGHVGGRERIPCAGNQRQAGM
jgi:hypothetical protein